MIRKNPIIIVCPSEDASFYRDFPLPGEELMIVSSGQAICSVVASEIDLVLLDCGFDVRFGLKLLDDLKRRFPHIPILFVTEQSSEEIVKSAFKLGARDFFQKPLPVFKVRDLLVHLLLVKRDAREPRGHTSANLSVSGREGNLCEIGVLQPSVMRVVCHIETHFKEAMTLAQMAELANMSKYHFVRLFNSEVGMSPVRYLKFVRIQRAKEMLKRSDLSIFATAIRVGFQDVSNFNKNFKNIEGCTPSQYRIGLRQPMVSTDALPRAL